MLFIVLITSPKFRCRIIHAQKISKGSQLETNITNTEIDKWKESERISWNRILIEPSGVEVGDFLLDLLAKGSYLNLINEEGATFLHLMLANCSSVIGKVEIYQLIEELLDRGADLSAVDGKGASILHYAARYSLPEEVILLLLERGADLNVVDDNDKTILHYAARSIILRLLKMNWWLWILWNILNSVGYMMIIGNSSFS